MLRFDGTRLTKILVLGDLILDRYIEGKVERVSPEAPVPVLLQTSERNLLGGAGNVANNIRALGGEAYLAGIIGSDQASKVFIAIAEELGIRPLVAADENRITTVKTRYLGDRQQLLRVDSENVSQIPPNLERKLIEQVLDIMQFVHAVIISDYQKGAVTPTVLSQTIACANSRHIPILIDPKGNDFGHYKNADYIKPNLSELRLLTNMKCLNKSEIIEAAMFLSKSTNSNILVTLSNDGMLLCKKNGNRFALPTQAREVFDVSGAGDTSIASFAFALTQGQSPETAVHFANIAAGIAVSKIGTAAISLSEINVAYNETYSNSGLKDKAQLADLNTASVVRTDWAAKNLKVGFTNGCFDLLHPGHITLLSEAAKKCDRLIVAINSNSSVKRLKGSQRPIQDEEARAEVLIALEAVDLVIIFDEDTPLNVIEVLRPDVLVKGSDYEEKDIVGANFIRSLGGTVERIQLKPGHSTTSLVKRVSTR